MMAVARVVENLSRRLLAAADPAQHRATARLIRVALVGGGAAAFVAAFWANRGAVVRAFAEGNYLWLGPALAVYFVAMTFAMIGWHGISRWLAISRGVRFDATSYALSTVAGRIPGGIWGAVARVSLYRARSVDPKTTAIGWGMEQALILLCAALCLPPWLLYSQEYRDRLHPGGLILLAGITGGVVLIVIMTGRVPGLLEHWRAGRVSRRTSRSLVGWMLAYSIVWCLGGVMLYLTLRVFVDVSSESLPTVEVAWLASRGITLLITILPSGLGLTEASLALLLTPLVPTPVAAAVAILVRLLTTLGEALVATGLYALAEARPMTRGTTGSSVENS